MNNKDPKYLKIPNINFSIYTDDNREEEFSKQRLERGFDESEGWALDCTIANFILPRLKAFKHMYNDKEDNICDNIINALELIVRNEGNRIWTKKERIIVKKGLRVLADYFLNLWW